MHLAQMLTIKIEVFSFALAVCVLVNWVFVIALIFAGFSSGANVAGALELLAGRFRGMTVVVMICDSGLKYLSTDLWA